MGGFATSHFRKERSTTLVAFTHPSDFVVGYNQSNCSSDRWCTCDGEEERVCECFYRFDIKVYLL